MTENKPIIIHDIDVSRCEQITYKDSLNPMCGNTSICCYGRENCHFKQLACKEQECEELKSVRDSWISKCEQETKMKELYRDGLGQLKTSKEQAEQKFKQIRQIVNKLSLSINWNINKNAYEKLQSIIQIIDEAVSE